MGHFTIDNGTDNRMWKRHLHLYTRLYLCDGLYILKLSPLQASFFQLFDSKFNTSSKIARERNTSTSVELFGWGAIFSPEFPAIASR
ncbi:hypothetical protein HNY73_002085 [Argiope bruennichi]|uniref:Uncharacterized protein n=1 Tax=Argiope bruennichi TaxID=94029 RepID=A0A8T0FSB6_ARGBR|nr:hypothetical protein HNY73_002085 [Argiope bruennichi]